VAVAARSVVAGDATAPLLTCFRGSGSTEEEAITTVGERERKKERKVRLGPGKPMPAAASHADVPGPAGWLIDCIRCAIGKDRGYKSGETHAVLTHLKSFR
jgi:hypothetical protein